jgi:uncharacterized protein YuzE
MKVKYDREADAAYITLIEGKTSVDSETVAPHIVVDYDEEENIIGVEILFVSRRTPAEFRDLAIFNNEQKAEFKTALMQALICSI